MDDHHPSNSAHPLSDVLLSQSSENQLLAVQRQQRQRHRIRTFVIFASLALLLAPAAA